MRDQQTLKDYFDHYLHRHRVRKGQSAPNTAVPSTDDTEKENVVQKLVLSPKRLLKKTTEIRLGAIGSTTSLPLEDQSRLSGTALAGEGDDSNATDPLDRWESEVDEVVLVRKLGSLSSLRARRTAVLRQLEVVRARRHYGYSSRRLTTGTRQASSAGSQGCSSLQIKAPRSLSEQNTSSPRARCEQRAPRS